MTIVAGCSSRAWHGTLSGATMGTTFSVQVVEVPASIDKTALQESVRELLVDLESRLSTYLPDSEISRINASRSQDWLPVSASFCRLLSAAFELSRQTQGAFDVTIGTIVNVWGFGPGDRLDEPPRGEAIARAVAAAGHENVQLDCTRPALRKTLPNTMLDLSAYAKGYAVDRVAELLQARGIERFLVEIGGELRGRGRNASERPWSIAIEKPTRGGRAVQSIVHIDDNGLATSGDYRNFFEHAGVRYSHTLDPTHGRPVRHNAASVTVIAPTASEADALATALLVMGPAEGMDFAEQQEIAAYFLLRDSEKFTHEHSTHFAKFLRAEAP